MQLKLLIQIGPIILFCFFFKELSAQVTIEHHVISNNDTMMSNVLISNTSKSVTFFCPIKYVDKKMFFKSARDLEQSPSLDSVVDLTIHFVYFLQDPINMSKGLKLISSDSKDTIFIGQFDCYFKGFNEYFMQRAKNRTGFDFILNKPFVNSDLTRVQIVDTTICFGKIPDRIPIYSEFIRESIKPTFSLDEKFLHLKDSVTELEEKMVFLLEQNRLLNEQIDSLKKTNQNMLEMITNNSGSSKKKKRPSN